VAGEQRDETTPGAKLDVGGGTKNGFVENHHEQRAFDLKER
jgi:hypothetical protein